MRPSKFTKAGGTLKLVWGCLQDGQRKRPFLIILSIALTMMLVSFPSNGELVRTVFNSSLILHCKGYKIIDSGWWDKDVKGWRVNDGILMHDEDCKPLRTDSDMTQAFGGLGMKFRLREESSFTFTLGNGTRVSILSGVDGNPQTGSLSIRTSPHAEPVTAQISLGFPDNWTLFSLNLSNWSSPGICALIVEVDEDVVCEIPEYRWLSETTGPFIIHKPKGHVEFDSILYTSNSVYLGRELIHEKAHP